jgi:sugar phosphate isomerase/epimerase
MLKYSVNQITLPGTTFEEDIRLLGRLGAPAIGVLRHKLAGPGAAAGAKLIADAGLGVSVLLGLGGFRLEDPSTWATTFDDLRSALADAATIGAGHLLLSSGPPGALSYEEAEVRFREILATALPEAADRGVPFAFEPNHALRVDLGYVHSLHDGLDLADDVDSPWFSVIVETNNCWIERHLYDNLANRSHRIGLVQINDFAAGTLSTPDRVPLGEGMIPLPRILGALVDAGYDGYFEIEVVGPTVERLGGEETTRRCIDYLTRLGL